MEKIMTNLDVNMKEMLSRFDKCSDIMHTKMTFGEKEELRGILFSIEVNVATKMLQSSALGRFLQTMQKENISWNKIEENAMAITDISFYSTYSEAVDGILIGDVILFLDGFDKAIRIPDAGFPRESLHDVESEKAIRGSNEGFSDSVKQNTSLLRKRLRSSKMKVEEMKLGTRTKTLVDVVYMEDIVNQDILQQVKDKLDTYIIDGILDSGMVEQLTEDRWYSPFPQVQTTQRPDRAVMAMLEGRVVILADNSPTALIAPGDFNSFIRTADDYYNRFEIATMGRIIRYVASFFALVFPGFYLAVTNFHTQILPTSLLLSFAAARENVPFPSVVEVVLMEIAFELLREAGVRLPGAMGNTIGIVGGLIIGQAAVDANIVSPVVVIVVAFTALCSFAIPNEEFAGAFRLLKYILILFSAWLGFYGFLLSFFAVVIHLSSLLSYGHPYLSPFVAGDLNRSEDTMDSIVRFPLFRLKKRSHLANKNQRIKLRKKSEGK